MSTHSNHTAGDGNRDLGPVILQVVSDYSDKRPYAIEVIYTTVEWTGAPSNQVETAYDELVKIGQLVECPPHLLVRLWCALIDRVVPPRRVRLPEARRTR